MPNKSIPTVVLGGSGYVAAEILGLLFNHPSFRVESIISSSQSGSRVDEVFPHLAGVAEDFTFSPIESAHGRLAGKRQVAVFSAMPHGETAPIFGGFATAGRTWNGRCNVGPAPPAVRGATWQRRS